MIPSKHIMKSLQRGPFTTNTLRSTSPAFTTRQSHLQVLSDTIDMDYRDLSKQSLLNLLTQSNTNLEEYKVKYQTLCLQSDSLKATIVELNDHITHLLVQVEGLRIQNQQVRRYQELLKEKYQTQIQGLESNGRYYEESFESEKNEEIRRREEVYKGKLERLVVEFENYKESKEKRDTKEEYRRLLETEMNKFQLLRENYEGLKDQLDSTREEYVKKQQQLQAETLNSSNLSKEIQVLKQTNQILRQELKQSIDRDNDKRGLQKLTQTLKSSYEKKVGLLEQTIRQEKCRAEKERQCSKRYKEEKRVLRVRCEELEMRVKETEGRYLQVFVELGETKKQSMGLERQLKMKEMEVMEKNSIRTCLTEREERPRGDRGKARGHLKVLVREVKEMRIKLNEMREQMKFSLEIERQRFRSYTKECESMVLLTITSMMKDRREERAEEGAGESRRLVMQNQIQTLSSEMKRIKKEMSLIQDNEFSTTQQILDLKKRMESNKENRRQNREEGRKTERDGESNKTFKSYENRNKSVSMFNGAGEERFIKSHRLLNDIYEEIDQQQEKITHNQIRLKHYRNSLHQ